MSAYLRFRSIQRTTGCFGLQTSFGSSKKASISGISNSNGSATKKQSLSPSGTSSLIILVSVVSVISDSTISSEQWYGCVMHFIWYFGFVNLANLMNCIIRCHMQIYNIDTSYHCATEIVQYETSLEFH